MNLDKTVIKLKTTSLLLILLFILCELFSVFKYRHYLLVIAVLVQISASIYARIQIKKNASTLSDY